MPNKKTMLTSGLLIALGFIGLYVFLYDSDINRAQYKLNYDKSGELVIVIHGLNSSKQTVPLDKEALDLFSSIKFCGLGDTTPEGWINITTDKGNKAGIGIILPNIESGQTLSMQSGDTGHGGGCTRRDQKKFEKFFDLYIKEFI